MRALNVFVVLALLFAIGATTFYLYHFGGNGFGEHQRWAEAGDFFGGILGAFFSFMSFLAVVWALTLQIEELASTRHQMERTNELKERELNRNTLQAAPLLDSRVPGQITHSDGQFCIVVRLEMEDRRYYPNGAFIKLKSADRGSFYQQIKKKYFSNLDDGDLDLYIPNLLEEPDGALIIVEYLAPTGESVLYEIEVDPLGFVRRTSQPFLQHSLPSSASIWFQGYEGVGESQRISWLRRIFSRGHGPEDSDYDELQK